jgi:hypothetical protein
MKYITPKHGLLSVSVFFLVRLGLPTGPFQEVVPGLLSEHDAMKA